MVTSFDISLRAPATPFPSYHQQPPPPTQEKKNPRVRLKSNTDLHTLSIYY